MAYDENFSKENVLFFFFSDDVRLRSPVIQKPFQTKSDTSVIVACDQSVLFYGSVFFYIVKSPTAGYSRHAFRRVVML